MPQSPSTEKECLWKERLHRQQASGLSIRQWCQQNEISRSVFDYWKRRLNISTQRSSFAELHTQETGIRLECQGITVHIDPHFDPVTLNRCLSILRGIAT